MKIACIGLGRMGWHMAAHLARHSDKHEVVVYDVNSESGQQWAAEQSTWDHDNDGIVNWADDDWDGDGISNKELCNSFKWGRYEENASLGEI